MDTQAKIKEVKKEIKNKYNLSNRDVSIKLSYCGYSEAVNAVIKTKKGLLKEEEIKGFINTLYSVDRCERTGEILQGGNTYINFTLDLYLENELKNKVMPIIEKAMNNQGDTIKYNDKIECCVPCGHDLNNLMLVNVKVNGKILPYYRAIDLLIRLIIK